MWPFRRRLPDDAAAADRGPRILVASFGRLFWYFPATERLRLVHERAGKYYGIVPAAGAGEADTRVAVVSRPDQGRDDLLLVVDALRGRVLRRTQLASRDTHQMVRDGDSLLVTDTWRGNVLEYALPEVRLRRTYGGFTHEDHVNSIHAEGSALFVLCHAKGKSRLVRLDRESGRVVDVWPDVGEHSHDVVPHGDAFLVCDSRGGGLVAVDRATKACRTLHADPGRFTKGLVVEDGVAWFASSPAAKREDRFHVRCELLGFDLSREELTFRRPLESAGLVNALATPASLAGQCAPIPRAAEPERAGPRRG